MMWYFILWVIHWIVCVYFLNFKLVLVNPHYIYLPSKNLLNQFSFTLHRHNHHIPQSLWLHFHRFPKPPITTTRIITFPPPNTTIHGQTNLTQTQMEPQHDSTTTITTINTTTIIMGATTPTLTLIEIIYFSIETTNVVVAVGNSKNPSLISPFQNPLLSLKDSKTLTYLEFRPQTQNIKELIRNWKILRAE